MRIIWEGKMIFHRWMLLGVFIFPALLWGQEKMNLEQIIHETLDKNTALLAERANISVAEARILTARLRPNPSLSLSANHLDLLGTGFNDQNGGGPSEFTAHTDYLLETADKRKSRIEVAQSSKSIVELRFQNVVRLAVLDLQNAFIDVLLSKETISLAEQNAASFQKIVEINDVRLKVGEIAQVEYSRSQLAALQSANEVLQARLRLNQSLIRLQTAMGRESPSRAFDVTGSLRNDATLPTLDQIQQNTFEDRPDWRAASAEIDLAGAEYRSQVAQARSDFTLGAEYTRQQVNAKANSLGFTLEVPLPFFNRNQGEIMRAQVERKQAEWRRSAQKSQLAGEVENAYQQAITAKSMMESIGTQMVEQARSVRDTMEFSYKRGEASLLELFDAQRAANDTFQAFNEARAEYARSLYLLDAVSGKRRTP
jgi:outer membrane protein, heavy metal efflux system